ncbi:src kinase-associated phosphoprotein 2 isoform X2 [Gadus macrocephalus]|uniref:src kinase-associated phosphoprotein 2 isoform X2 n=1 Tax=Gadus macrocephalus TaxID=80720 RepID=UPI0028CB2F41|nr:src kinase-associated phosphoprotein 2 isoform X2 [Gadus macrocephalus]
MRYEELTTLVSDLETFLNDGLKGENLSKKAKEKKEAFIKRIKEVKLGFPQDFKEKSGEDSGEEDESDSHNDGGSMHSERTDKDEEASEGVQQAPAIAAQDLPYVFKAGYLEKRRKEHSFFGTEWQKRWCALSSNTFYYYGNEKDKQQKGEFSIDGYIVKLNHTLRKDSKKECCFEISASDKRVYQFCASSQKEAEEWVKQIDFVLRDMSGISKTWICIHNLGCLVFFLCCIRINKGPPGLELQVQNLSNITSIWLRLRFAVHGLQCLIVPCLCFAAVLVLTYNTKEKVKYKDIYSCP